MKKSIKKAHSKKELYDEENDGDQCSGNYQSSEFESHKEEVKRISPSLSKNDEKEVIEINEEQENSQTKIAIPLPVKI